MVIAFDYDVTVKKLRIIGRYPVERYEIFLNIR